MNISMHPHSPDVLNNITSVKTEQSHMLVSDSQSRRSLFDFSQSRKYSYPAHLATEEITHYFFILVKEALNISLRRSKQFFFIGKSPNPQTFVSILFWTIYLSEEWARTIDNITIKTADFW